MKARLLSGLVVLCLCACAMGPIGNSHVPEPAKDVDPERYLGKWYEMARYPQYFENGCEGVTAEYSKGEDGAISVLNTCHKGSANGLVETATGRATIVPGSNNAKLKVSFFRPFNGNYWVLDHADDYSWSIVGEPSGHYLWLLARQAKLSQREKDDLTVRIKAMGYDLSLLHWTEQE